MAQHQYVFQLERLKKVVPPDKIILDDITLAFLPGAKIGVIGHNGAGKSSLLRIMAGQDQDFMGEARPAPNLKVGFLEQEPHIDESKDVLGNVEDGVREQREVLDRFNAIAAKFAEPMDDEEMNKLLEEQGKLQDQIDAQNLWELDRTIEVAMDSLRLPPPDADVSKLSGGEKRRVALCRLLLEKPDMLLLDEPTNHLDAESVGWLENYLKDYAGTVIVVTHDRYFLDNVTGWILELDRGRALPWQGNYSSWLEQKQERMAREEKQESARRKVLQRELEWIRMSPKARQAKSKARIRSYDELVRQDQKARMERVQITIPPGPRLGGKIIEGEGVTKGYGDRLLIEDFSFSIPAGAIVGIIGPNGVGKTTLFRMITGQEQPDGGRIEVGETVELSHVDQFRTDLDPGKNIWEEISGGSEHIRVGDREINSRAYVAGFNFKGPEQQKKVGKLSGGERNRLHLAKLLRNNGNVLLLDEPSNDLDVDTLRALEDALVDYPGCALVISHDRWFLDRICTHIMAFEGDSQVRVVDGNYQDYEADLKRRLGDEADHPHRVRFKKFHA